MAGPFSRLSLLPAAAGAAKSLSVSPGSSALACAPTGTRRRAGERASRRWRWRWQQRPRARPWLGVQSAPEEFFALPSLPFHSLFFFFSRGVKKPHNLRMCARVEIDVGRKKGGEGGVSSGPCGRRRSAPPRSGFPGAEGEADSAGRCCLILLPPPLPSALSLSALARRGDEALSSLPPLPAMPGHFCYLETFPPRECSGPSPHETMDKWHLHAPGVGSGRFWTLLTRGHESLSPCPKLLPFTTGTLTRSVAAPRASKG